MAACWPLKGDTNMANYMAEVARLLGVEMNKDFECEESSCTYRITEHGLTCNGCYGADSLMMILNGERKIKQGPWRPENDEPFFVVSFDGHIMIKYWDDESTVYRSYYKLGNCYRYKDEAEENRDKWISFYTSCEVLEI
jgi:hypothetical protein